VFTRRTLRARSVPREGAEEGAPVAHGDTQWKAQELFQCADGGRVGWDRLGDVGAAAAGTCSSGMYELQNHVTGDNLWEIPPGSRQCLGETGSSGTVTVELDESVCERRSLDYARLILRGNTHKYSVILPHTTSARTSCYHLASRSECSKKMCACFCSPVAIPLTAARYWVCAVN